MVAKPMTLFTISVVMYHALKMARPAHLHFICLSSTEMTKIQLKAVCIALYYDTVQFFSNLAISSVAWVIFCYYFLPFVTSIPHFPLGTFFANDLSRRPTRMHAIDRCCRTREYGCGGQTESTVDTNDLPLLCVKPREKAINLIQVRQSVTHFLIRRPKDLKTKQS